MGHSHDVPARRNFLKLSARLAALGLTSLGVQPARHFFVRDVQGQGRVTDYKALVCVYMFGGNDANNVIVPADNYTAYSTARGGTAGVALAANTLLPIPGPAGATYGLHPSLTELVPIYNAGYLAFVLNTVDWLVEEPELIAIRSRGAVERGFEPVAGGAALRTKLAIVLIPMLVLWGAGGAVMWRSRSRRAA